LTPQIQNSNIEIQNRRKSLLICHLFSIIPRKLWTFGDFPATPGNGRRFPAEGQFQLSAWMLDRLEGRKRFFQDSALFGPIPRFAEHGSPRKAHVDPAGWLQDFHSSREVRHGNGGNAPSLDFPCDQTPGLVA
jgi:hypothetical protein